jgi:hypothetical protein
MSRHGRHHVILRTLLGLIVWGALSSMTRDVWALTTITNPFGTAATAWINYDPDDGGNWINWQENSTGNCSYNLLGYGGFSDDFVVQASNSGDIISFVPPSQSFAFCGYNQQYPNYNGHYLDIHGGSGDDRLTTYGGDTYLIGYGGDDKMLSGGGASLYLDGGDGNDSLLLDTSNGASVYGDAGNDCIGVSSAATNCTMSCGDGSDTWSGPGSMPSDCETNSSECCPGFIC